MKKRVIELSSDNRNERIRLPVNPAVFDFSETALNTKITLVNIGEANLLGSRGLVTGTLSSFFPAPNSPFYRYADRSPTAYIDRLTKWKNSAAPIRIIVSDSDFNLMMSIDKIQRSYAEGSKDIGYSLDLTEYRKLNVPSVKVSTTVNRPSGLQNRPNTNETGGGQTYTVVNGDSLWAIAKKHYGNGAQYTKIFEANKDKVSNPNAIHPGQVLTIP